MIVRESIEFERGMDPKSKMGLGFVTLELQFMPVLYDDEAWEEGIYQFDMEDPETSQIVQDFKDIGIKYEIIPDLLNDDQPFIKFTGTREQMAKVLEIYRGEPAESFLPILRKWDGKSDREFGEMIEEEFDL